MNAKARPASIRPAARRKPHLTKRRTANMRGSNLLPPFALRSLRSVARAPQASCSGFALRATRGAPAGVHNAHPPYKRSSFQNVPKIFAALLMFCACVLTARKATSHEVGLSRRTYTGAAASITADLVFAGRELGSLVPTLDADRDENVSEAELSAARVSMGQLIAKKINVSSGDARCTGELKEVKDTDADGVELTVVYTCPTAVSTARVEFALLDDLAFGHRHIARVAAGPIVNEIVISRALRSFDVPVAPGAAVEKPKTSSGAMFLFGVEHILTGYDHLVFLIGLVLVGGRARSLLWVVTAFTLAHSITLALAALGVWAPRASIVEPAIALSIAYVGVENFFVKNAEKRWRITFPFGLIHGFGFAGALRELAVQRQDTVRALFLFNAGVEAGQLAVLVVLLPLLGFLRPKPWFEKFGVRGASALIVAAGLVWFVVRVFGG
ncbi:MAG: HupE/UreJ family protein [Polyangiaceae bacterium]|nr:HupE/UreJ family protein [Polyangiaceae bacterium]